MAVRQNFYSDIVYKSLCFNLIQIFLNGLVLNKDFSTGHWTTACAELINKKINYKAKYYLEII